MKLRILLGLVFSLLALNSLLAGPRDAQWQAVHDAQKRSLPRTAIEQLDPILKAALADKAYPEAIRALCLKISLEAGIEGLKPTQRVIRLQAEMAKAPEPMKPMLEVMLAEWFYSFYSAHRYQYLTRTTVESSVDSDPLTWDLSRTLEEVDRHFAAALAHADELKQTPIAQYDDLLSKGTAADSYRPTAYDFIAAEALNYYQMNEMGPSTAEDAFELTDDSPIFADVKTFLTWHPESADTHSPKLKAIQLLQSLLRFHEADADRTAFFENDLARLVYGFNAAQGDNKIERYKTALDRLISTTSTHEISSRALAKLASQYLLEGEPAKAHELALRGQNGFPQSIGAKLCAQIINQVETKQITLTTEENWNAPWPTVDIGYRNVIKVYFRAIPESQEEIHDRRSAPGYAAAPAVLKKYVEAKPALEWSSDLPATSDDKVHQEKLPVPTTLKAGGYTILASHDPEFGQQDNQLSVAHIQVTDLAMLLRNDSMVSDGLILKALSGEPVAGAKVRVWDRDNQGRFSSVPWETMTDPQGRFDLADHKRIALICAEADGQCVWGGDFAFYFPRPDSREDRKQTLLFMDRAIYRPGQTISYKGIGVRFNTSDGKYGVRANEHVTVIFQDSNRKEIARAEHITNDYGSFSGSFTAPRDRLTGMMSFAILDEPGMRTFRVEEYKRPKFSAEILAPKQPAKLWGPVTVIGQATAYSGAPMGGAKVKWSVLRQSQLPSWCWWWTPSSQKAIGHGTTTTNADGSFNIQFTAAPDLSIPTNTEPTFAFEVHAEIVDNTGETQTAIRTVRLGYASLQATVSAAKWQITDQPIRLTIKTESLDGNAQSADGIIKIYALKQPDEVSRPALNSPRYGQPPSAKSLTNDLSNPEHWESGVVMTEKKFKTNAEGKDEMPFSLPAGAYRVMLEATDAFSHPITARTHVRVISPASDHYTIKEPFYSNDAETSIEPGHTLTAIWGTGYASGRAFVEVSCAEKLLKSYWTEPGRTQEKIELPITEKMRGGVTIHTLFVHENRAFTHDEIVDVPWSNKEFTIKWDFFRSKLSPGAKETWTATVSSKDGKSVPAEFVATLYDASLDQFTSMNWNSLLRLFRHEYGYRMTKFQNTWASFIGNNQWKIQPDPEVRWSYRAFADDLVQMQFPLLRNNTRPFMSEGMFNVGRGGDISDEIHLDSFYVASAMAAPQMRSSAVAGVVGVREENEAPGVDLGQVHARKNLNETAFFFPQLLTDSEGHIKLQFTMPEALTQWRFIGMAHDAQMRSGLLTDTVFTSKDLMVEPNPPRFVREGDEIEFTVKVSNLSDQPQRGSVKLGFTDAASDQSVDGALANRHPQQTFDLLPKSSHTFSWHMAVPDGLNVVAYKAVASSGKFSDGEEGYLPVLSRRILVTESVPLPIRGKATKSFTFQKLLDSDKSPSLKSQSLTVQMVSQPAWYAVMSLPYLMEFPHECSEQVFSRYYANSVAQFMAESDPKIRRVFDLWKNTAALASPLEKNQDLKSVLLEETPWVRDAEKESESRKRVGLLFDQNRLTEEAKKALQTLDERQGKDGLWSWFPSGPSSEYISLYIMTGFGRLRHLGVSDRWAPAVRSLEGLDAWAVRDYRLIQENSNAGDYQPTSVIALYLYGRSFYLAESGLNADTRTAVDFYLNQARKFWPKMTSRQSQAHLALAFDRFGDHATALEIVKSLKERSTTSDELGRYWNDSAASWWWYDAPIETQAMMIEVFAEVTHDTQAVDECQVWLLKQKQTQHWPSTKATADAIYALLLRGQNLLSSDALVEVSLGGQTIKPEQVEAGTGFYEEKFVRNEIKPAQGHITVKKTDDGVSWGSATWQYLEDITRVTPHADTPLNIKKRLFIKEFTKQGPVLKPVTGDVAVGDELVVRLELRTDRDMEFVHLKDQRGSGTEPVSVLSRYSYRDGLHYYESTRDTATHYFIDYLPKGTYVLEYSTHVQLKGHYQTGIAEVECMYAPDFNSHSESLALSVK